MVRPPCGPSAELPLRKDVEWAGSFRWRGVWPLVCVRCYYAPHPYALWENHKREVITFTLGPPGQAHQVPAC